MTELIIRLETGKQNGFEISSITVSDPLGGRFVINKEKSITVMCLFRAVAYKHWFEVSEILRNDYNCCCNNIETKVLIEG